MTEPRYARVVGQSGLLLRKIISLLGGPTRVIVEDASVRFERSDGSTAGDLDVRLMRDIAIHRVGPLLSWRITATGLDGEHHSIYALSRGDAERVRSSVTGIAAEHAKEVGPRLLDLDARLSSGGYMRFMVSRRLHGEIVEAVKSFGQFVEHNLEEAPFRAFSRLYRLVPRDAFDDARRTYNRQFIEERVPAIRNTAIDQFNQRLTDEQCAAIATDEDATLVLAGAGTGKTSVITGKIADLVLNQGVSPRDVLVLTFNNKAAKQIRGRLPARLSGTVVSTFHAFGRGTVAKAAQGNPTVSRLANSSEQLVKHLQDSLDVMVNDPKTSAPLVDYVAYYGRPYKSPWDFKNQGQYEAYTRNVGLVTLMGDRVKSYEELMIANFLARNGIAYEYEKPYEHPTRSIERRQYQPDFYLTKHKIYIEHFALDKKGRAPRDWDWRRYERDVSWKRETHTRAGTQLVETFSWQHRDRTLLEYLARELRGRGVPMTPVPDREWFDKLRNDFAYSSLAEFSAKFLNHVKTSQVDLAKLRKRAANSVEPARAETFLKVFEQLYNRYSYYLSQRNESDFHDMINEATNVIRDGRGGSPFKYVLVDEFQDISAGRLELLMALNQEETAYFFVGDDWQSIYRFAGSDVSLVKELAENSGEHFEYVETMTLPQTFRYGSGIEGASSWFVRKNPAQTQRLLRPFGEVKRDEGVTVVWSTGNRQGLDEALSDIQRANGGGPGAVYVLTRYNRTQREVGRRKQVGRLRVGYSTVHGAKGEEDEYVVVLDLIKDLRARTGFPSGGDDEDPLLELVLPPVASEDGYEFAEERRLFYVAMTRAKYGVYLVADSGRPSQFVEELLDQFGKHPSDYGGTGRVSVLDRPADEASPAIHEIGKRAEPCPQCNDGRLFIRYNRDDGSAFLGCSNYFSDLGCRYTKDAPDHSPRNPPPDPNP